ncbi:MAG TPA: ABC transporter permease [Vicinamibacterales bacterium]|nr:ABC transporter permease [Vicinamibacterales bacterium]
MKKIALIAVREFVTAVTNRGFIIGLLLVPVLGGLLLIALPRIFNPGRLEVRGEVAIVDTTGVVMNDIRTALAPETITARRDAGAREVLASAPEAARQVRGGNQAIANLMGPLLNLDLFEHAAPADIQEEKRWLSAESSPRRLAVVVIHADAVIPTEDAQLGTYDLYVAPNVDPRVEDVIQDGLRDALVTARVRAQHLERERVEALLRVPRARGIVVASGEERKSLRGFDILLPMTLAGLLLFGTMMGGQALLTSTIEEKSSRVIEVLLSAVSPLEFMAGKILGHLSVSLLVLAVYTGLGVLSLVAFAVIGLLDPWLIVYLLAFFLATFVLFGAVFASAGAAVNDLKEAQALMGPIMLMIMGPWVLAFPIARTPDSTLAVVLSFVPPINAFVMMVRLGSRTPPPTWQALLSLGIACATASAAVWAAAKIFRIGLLMYGKPPNFRTLVRWVRAA